MLKLQNIAKIYRTTDVETRALQDVSFDVGAGEFVAIMGPSGCGKSTLLNILGLLDSPTSGRLLILRRRRRPRVGKAAHRAATCFGRVHLPEL